MANYVVDASIVIQRLIRQPYTPNAQVLFRQAPNPHQLIVPEFCLLECTNVLWKQVRFFGLPQFQAEQLVKGLRALPLQRAPVKRLLDSALNIGLKHQITVYDSVYIRLAIEFGYPLITVDESQARSASTEGVNLEPITNLRNQPLASPHKLGAFSPASHGKIRQWCYNRPQLQPFSNVVAG
jgi:predicted nucleic acid-binding protein